MQKGRERLLRVRAETGLNNFMLWTTDDAAVGIFSDAAAAAMPFTVATT